MPPPPPLPPGQHDRATSAAAANSPPAWRDDPSLLLRLQHEREGAAAGPTFVSLANPLETALNDQRDVAVFTPPPPQPFVMGASATWPRQTESSYYNLDGGSTNLLQSLLLAQTERRLHELRHFSARTSSTPVSLQQQQVHGCLPTQLEHSTGLGFRASAQNLYDEPYTRAAALHPMSSLLSPPQLAPSYYSYEDNSLALRDADQARQTMTALLSPPPMPPSSVAASISTREPLSSHMLDASPFLQHQQPPISLHSHTLLPRDVPSRAAAAALPRDGSTNHWHQYPPLPRKLACTTDAAYLTKFQVFLRLNIEAFCATEDDVLTHVRGRNKHVRLHQVGIRCRHCAHVPSAQRKKGAVYFPATTLGFYQAAQNMSSTHLQCGACPEMPPSIQTMLTELLATKTTSNHSKVGSKYWKDCVEKEMGLINTDHGVYTAFH